jgi:hypothetical protein
MQGKLYNQLKQITADKWDSRLADAANWRFEESRSEKPTAVFRLNYRCKLTGWEYLGGFIDVDQLDLDDKTFRNQSDPRGAWVRFAVENIMKMLESFDRVVKQYMAKAAGHTAGIAGSRLTVAQYANPEGLIIRPDPKLTKTEKQSQEKFTEMFKQYQSWKKRSGKR